MKATGSRRTDLVRALNLLPYFRAHPGRSVFEAAQDLGRSPKELMGDLDRLFLCGRPGLMPDDLVDLRKDYRRVEILDSQGLDKALRLTSSESAALLLTLESLENVPGLADVEAVRSVAEKLRANRRQVRGVADATPAAEGADAQTIVLTAVREAIADARRLRFTYTPARSDESSVREVSPVALFTHDGQTYLRALIDTAPARRGRGRPKAAADERTFRLDRMRDPEVLDAVARRASTRPDVDSRDPFRFGSRGKKASLMVHVSLAWLADSAPLELHERRGDWIAAEMSYGSAPGFLASCWRTPTRCG